MKTLTSGEIASYCDVNLRTVIRWIESGKLKGFKLPGRGNNRVLVEDFVAFLERHDMPIPDSLKGIATPSILIVDDINDSGDTLNGILTRLEHVGSEVKVKTATLLSKSTSINKVDYYARELTTPEELDSWYVFPWEQLN